MTSFASYTVGARSALIAGSENRWRRVVVITLAGTLRVSFNDGDDAGQSMRIPLFVPLLVAPNQSLYLREHTGTGVVATGSVIVSDAVEV